MLFTNDFEKKAFIERAAFKSLLSLYNVFPGYEIMYTPVEGKQCYDVMLYKLNDGIMCDRVFIEIKVRDVVYSDYFLETKKINSIKKMCDDLFLTEDEYKILYMNFTPQGTYIWNCNIIKDIKITKQLMNKATSNNTTDKVLKSKYDLPTDKARKYNYTWDEQQLKKHYPTYLNKKVEDKIKKVGLEVFFDSL